MSLPTWATSKSNVKMVESPADRILSEQIKQTKEKEDVDPELSFPTTRTSSADFSSGQKSVEIQYEGNCLE
jgi:hypothetical protein